MTFSEINLSKPIWNALDDMGLTVPTSIQTKVFPVILSGRDVHGIAQTGTGKTLAYLLPLIKSWNYNKDRHAQILILVPTRELVIQVVEEARQLTTYMNTEIIGVYGGANLKVQAGELADGADIVVGTPGRVLDLVYHGALSAKFIKKLVIDEVDEMLNLGFRKQLTDIFDLLPIKRQNLLFSATTDESIDSIIDEYFNGPELVEAAPPGTPIEKIELKHYQTINFNTKINFIKYQLRNNDEMNKVLLFASTKSLADKIFEHLHEDFDGKVGIIHSNKDQNFRFNAVKSFDSGTTRILIATDIIARGLDFIDVSHVINFDVPDGSSQYIHRIGRTGRADKNGVAITYVSDLDIDKWNDIRNDLTQDWQLLVMPEEVEVSNELIEMEIPVVHMKNTLGKLPEITESESAYFVKSAKNKKTNTKISYKEKMQVKYGKPISRGQKKKGKKK